MVSGADREVLEPVPPAKERPPLDQLDYEIVRQLQADGRKPYRAIARVVGVSEGTVRLRVRRLVEAQALRIVAIADPFQLGCRVLAFVLIAVGGVVRTETFTELRMFKVSYYYPAIG
jgi:DNA-binding Lrp family transcriptional regulator